MGHSDPACGTRDGRTETTLVSLEDTAHNPAEKDQAPVASWLVTQPGTASPCLPNAPLPCPELAGLPGGWRGHPAPRRAEGIRGLLLAGISMGFWPPAGLRTPLHRAQSKEGATEARAPACPGLRVHLRLSSSSFARGAPHGRMFLYQQRRVTARFQERAEGGK